MRDRDSRHQVARDASTVFGAAKEAVLIKLCRTVPDVEATLARAEELGGSRVYGPMPVDDHMQTGAFRDAAGNVFGVYHHAPH